MQQQPTFSVIIPTRDRAPLVRELVQQLSGAVGGPDEIVIVDDGSSGAHVDLLQELEPPTLVVRTRGVGPASARVEGVAASSGDWLVFLDDDDRPHISWMPTFRELLAAAPDASYLSVGFERRSRTTSNVVPPRPLGPAFSHQTANFVAGTFAVRRDLYLASGGFASGLRCMEFTDLAMRVFALAAEGGAVVVHRCRSTITIEVRDPLDRPSQQPEVLTEAFLTVYGQNRHHFDRDRRFLANQYSTIGVAWMRAGRPSEGRRWLRRAALVHPDPTTIVRIFVAVMPPARRRLWGAPVTLEQLGP